MTMARNTRSTRKGQGQKPLNVFFDAEGTLFNPKPGFTIEDFWSNPSLERAKRIFELDSHTREVLEYLKANNIPAYIVSLHEESILPGLLEFLGIKDYFIRILINGDKGRRIRELADQEGIPIESCVMVGDRYELDIQPTAREGIRGFLLDRPYNQGPDAHRIRTLDEILKLL